MSRTQVEVGGGQLCWIYMRSPNFNFTDEQKNRCTIFLARVFGLADQLTCCQCSVDTVVQLFITCWRFSHLKNLKNGLWITRQWNDWTINQTDRNPYKHFNPCVDFRSHWPVFNFCFISEIMGRRNKHWKCVEEKLKNLKRWKKQKQKEASKT